jgi:F-type H+-transporting ATPase subunit a
VRHPPNLFEFMAGSLPMAVSTLVACIGLLLLLGVAVHRGLAHADGIVPEPRLTLRNALEIMLEGVTSLMKDVIGHDWPRWLPLLGTLGLFILVSNLMGLVPFLNNPTSYIETNLAWALISFGTYHYAGVRHHGAAYVKHFFVGPPWLWPLMFVVEVIGHFARVFSLTIRLTANMFADHTLVALFLSMPIVSLFVPWLFVGLGVFVAFLQAFIFVFLTMIYIGLALEEAH